MVYTSVGAWMSPTLAAAEPSTAHAISAATVAVKGIVTVKFFEKAIPANPFHRQL